MNDITDTVILYFISLSLSLVGTWLKSQLSIPEQVSTMDQIFLLKKKFFVNDANVDQDDPVHLHLVYCQVGNNSSNVLNVPLPLTHLPCSHVTIFYRESIR